MQAAGEAADDTTKTCVEGALNFTISFFESTNPNACVLSCHVRRSLLFLINILSLFPYGDGVVMPSVKLMAKAVVIVAVHIDRYSCSLMDIFLAETADIVYALKGLHLLLRESTDASTSQSRHVYPQFVSAAYESMRPQQSSPCSPGPVSIQWTFNSKKASAAAITGVLSTVARLLKVRREYLGFDSVASGDVLTKLLSCVLALVPELGDDFEEDLLSACWECIGALPWLPPSRALDVLDLVESSGCPPIEHSAEIASLLIHSLPDGALVCEQGIVWNIATQAGWWKDAHCMKAMAELSRKAGPLEVDVADMLLRHLGDIPHESDVQRALTQLIRASGVHSEAGHSRCCRLCESVGPPGSTPSLWWSEVLIASGTKITEKELTLATTDDSREWGDMLKHVRSPALRGEEPIWRCIAASLLHMGYMKLSDGVSKESVARQLLQMLNSADRSRATCNAHLIFATVITLSFVEGASRDLFAHDNTDGAWACLSPLFGRPTAHDKPSGRSRTDSSYLRVTLPCMARAATNGVSRDSSGIGSKLSTSVLATARDLVAGSKCGKSCSLCQFAYGQVVKLVGKLTGEVEPYRALVNSNPRVVLDRGEDKLPPPLPEICKPFILPALFAAHIKRCRIRSLYDTADMGQAYFRSALIPALSSLWYGGRHAVCLLLDLPSTVTRLRSDKEIVMPLVGESLVQLILNALLAEVEEDNLKHYVLQLVRFLSLDDDPNVTNTGAMEDLVTDCLAEVLAHGVFAVPLAQIPSGSLDYAVMRVVLDIYGGRHCLDTIVEADCGGLLFMVLLRFARRFLYGTDSFDTIKAATSEKVDKILAHSARIIGTKGRLSMAAHSGGGGEPPTKRARSSVNGRTPDKVHAMKCYYLYVLKLITDTSIKGSEESACYCTALALLLDIANEEVLQLYWSQNLNAVHKLTLNGSPWQASEGEALLRPWKSLYHRARLEEKLAMLSTYMVELPRVGYDQARSYAKGLPKQVITDPHLRIMFGGDHTRLEEGQVKTVLSYVFKEITYSPPRPDCCIEGILVLLADLLLFHYAETWNDPYGELETLANQLDKHLTDLLQQRDAAAGGTLSIALARALGSLGRWRYNPAVIDRCSVTNPGHRARIGIEDPQQAWCDNSNGEGVAKELAVHLLLTYIVPKMGSAKYSYLAQAILTAMGGGNFLESAVADDLLSRVEAETLWPYLSTSYKVASATDERGLAKDASQWTVQTLARWVVRELPGTQNNTVKVRRLMLSVDLLLKQSSTVASEVLPTLVAALLYSNKDTHKMLEKLFQHMQEILGSKSAERPVLAVIIDIYEVVESWASKLGNDKLSQRLAPRLLILLQRDRQATYLSLSKAAERCEMWSHALMFIEKAYAPPSTTVMTSDDYVHLATVFSKMTPDAGWVAASEAGALAVAKKQDSAKICCDGVAADGVMDDNMTLQQREENWIRKAALLGKWSVPTVELKESSTVIDALVSIKEGSTAFNVTNAYKGVATQLSLGKRESTLMEQECRQKARTLFDLEWCLTNRSSLCLPQTLRVRVGTEDADKTVGRPAVAMAAIRAVGGNPQQLSHLLWEHLHALRRAGRSELAERVGIVCRAQPEIYREKSVLFMLEMSKVYRDLGKINKSREALEDVAQLLAGRGAQDADKDVAWCVKLDRLRYSCSKNLMQPRESIPVFREILAEATSLPAKRRARGHFAFAQYLDGLLEEEARYQSGLSRTLSTQKVLQEITVQYMLAIQFGTKHELLALNRILRIIWDQGSGALVNLIPREYLPHYEKCIGDLSKQVRFMFM